MEEHDVDITEGVHFSPAITTEGHDDKLLRFGFAEVFRASLGKEAAEEDVNEVAALPHHLTPACP